MPSKAEQFLNDFGVNKFEGLHVFENTNLNVEVVQWNKPKRGTTRTEAVEIIKKKQ